jgi:opine dehydrogenase
VPALDLLDRLAALSTVVVPGPEPLQDNESIRGHRGDDVLGRGESATQRLQHRFAPERGEQPEDDDHARDGEVGNNVNVAFMPADRGSDLIDEMREIHPFEKVYADVLEAGLSIVNPGVHAGPCLLSITAVENSPKRSFFLYEHGVTPSSCRVNVQIDNERKEIGRQLGYTLTPIEDFTGLRPGYTWQELYMSMHGSISLTPIPGPRTIDSRYFTEDAPYGLVPWSHIAKAVGVATPVIDSVVNIYNVVHEKDWWREGRSADDLGLAGLSVPQIKSYVKTGSA